ncbi:MAG: carnitine dehydratase [Candidatus Nephthysia bennettiae]|uniref:CoA transferase n=1 Tax=Candidatus Nephthysia bennettiae TaxID=3127016 RepID=A0A934NB48_9BACT|nr:CoA transferase [Candidatus Dormibacteraeota bacterium]MBJ7612243.1 CoA transferase [Candidatus Dormibacteraeota bacterium]PZR88014.1 MAG: carnitine dehydratase [Candidatus Dormibacteraeota bacterium]
MSLNGVRVLDLTRLLPGAFCSLLLADMGADVVKVEEPGSGDYMRWYPPLVDGQSALFNALNRNKRSLTLNLKSEAGRDLFKRLVSRADVVLEGNRPGVMDRLGVGWDVLRELNPRLVMCAITGYGQTGPWAQRAGHDLNYMAVSGALSLNAGRGQAPHPLAVQVADIGGGGQGAAVAILGALLEVARGGAGRFLDVSMTDGAFTWLAVPLAQVMAEGEPIPPGMHRLTGRYACYGVYRCADGRFMSVGALEPKFWRTLCEALDRPDLVEGQYSEGAVQEHLRAELASVFASRTRDQWAERLAGLEVCCEPVLDLDEAGRHPQVRARALVHEFETGSEIAPQVPFQPGWRRLGPPGLGQHTSEVLGEVGVGKARLEELRATGAV